MLLVLLLGNALSILLHGLLEPLRFVSKKRQAVTRCCQPPDRLEKRSTGRLTGSLMTLTCVCISFIEARRDPLVYSDLHTPSTWAVARHA